MSNVVTAAVAIEGDGPLLWKAVSRTGAEKSGALEVWQPDVLVSAAGQLYMELEELFACLQAGAKRGKKRVPVKLLQKALQPTPDERLLFDRFLPADLTTISTNPTEAIYFDVRRAQNRAAGTYGFRYRLGISPGWRASFRLVWDAASISPQQMETLIESVGQLQGLGDNLQIGFGRFRVFEFALSAGP